MNLGDSNIMKSSAFLYVEAAHSQPTASLYLSLSILKRISHFTFSGQVFAKHHFALQTDLSRKLAAQLFKQRTCRRVKLISV